MNSFFTIIDAINGVMLSVPMLVGLLCIGVLFTLWSGFCQWRSWTHGVALVAGKGIDTTHGPGALTHFQALTAALSGTVGLGAIAGMAIAVEFGGPGAVFWMWAVGIIGMALKSTEVTLSLLYRDTSDPANPHGGSMYVLRKGLAELSPKLAPLGAFLGVVFCCALLLFAVTGGNMFQTWTVADTTREYLGVPTWISGLVIATLAGIVLIGGIRRIGNVTKVLVPFKCGIYVLIGLYVILHNAEKLPDVIRLIFRSAFSPAEGGGAFIGGTLVGAFMLGMRRALFSSESGLGTAPIAHSAVKTPEPVTEGVVAGLEPFIDTIFVCTVTGLVILSTGVWNRGPTASWYAEPAFVEATPQHWQPATDLLPESDGRFHKNDPVFVMAETAPGKRTRIYGTVIENAQGQQNVAWRPLELDHAPALAERGIFTDYRGATLVAKSFDTVHPGLGGWLITAAVWIFALSTLITYGYYGETAITYLGAERWVQAFRWVWCFAAAAACFGFIKGSEDLDSISTVGMGFMYAINLPLMLVLGHKAMRAYHDYFRRLKAGQIARPR
ncbi:MAG TPA: amino acid carrier protein [Candidatus Binatia bacterium]|nr:amino acid carrier protein [Candidatus Binatia bacterium]